MVFDRSSGASTDDVYRDYVNWCGNGLVPIAQYYFSASMAERGIYKKKTPKATVFPGWSLKK
jgi:hypothetical protein